MGSIQTLDDSNNSRTQLHSVRVLEIMKVPEYDSTDVTLKEMENVKEKGEMEHRRRNKGEEKGRKGKDQNRKGEGKGY